MGNETSSTYKQYLKTTENPSAEGFQKFLEKRIEKDTKPGISDELRKKIKELSKKRLKRKYKKGDVNSGGKVLPTMEAAKGGIVKRYKGGLMVAPKRAKRGY